SHFSEFTSAAYSLTLSRCLTSFSTPLQRTTSVHAWLFPYTTLFRSAVAAVAQVAADIDAATVSTVTVHRGVDQGAVTADVHAGTIASAPAADDTVGGASSGDHTLTVAGGITRDTPPQHRNIKIHPRPVTGIINRD